MEDNLDAVLASDPQRVLSLLENLSQYVVVPHAAQQPVIDSNARFKVLNCGRRWGKTKIGAKMLLDAAREHPGSMNWWVAPTYRIVKRGYREVLRQLPPDFLTHDPPPDSNFDAGRPVILRLKNGANLEFYSAERPAGMLGEGVDFVVQDEAAKTPSTVWEQVISPTLIDHKGRGVLISTPEGRNWFYKRWLAGQDTSDPNWASWTFPSWTNPHLPPEEMERMKRDLPSLIYQQEVEAKFIAAGSSVFRWEEKVVQYDRVLDNGLVEDVPPMGQVFLGVDLAKTHDYTVFYGCRERDARNVYYERLNMVSWPEQKRRLARAVRTLRRHGAENVTLVMDSTGLGDPIQEDMEELGYDVIPINFTQSKNKMVVLLSKDLEEGKAMILDERIEEFESYQMGMTPGGRIQYGAPDGEHDDVVSAKMLQHFALVNEGAPNVEFVDDEHTDERAARSVDDEGEDWDDLIDDVGPYDHWIEDDDVVDEVKPVRRQPTPEELLANPAVWT